MSVDAEKIKGLIAFKKKLEIKVQEADTQLKELQAMLETLNSILLEKGFKHPEIAKKAAPPPTTSPREETVGEPEALVSTETEHETVTPLKSAAGELLANLYVTEDSLRVVLAQDKNFDINTPPFTPFLVERVLLKMQERDTEMARAGQVDPEKIFCYNIIRDGETIRELVIRNFGADRLRELKSSIRWTLEKMYEKMKTQS